MSGRACRRHGAVPREWCDGCRFTGLHVDLAEARAAREEAEKVLAAEQGFRQKAQDDLLAEWARAEAAEKALREIAALAASDVPPPKRVDRMARAARRALSVPGRLVAP
jgi:hypothetical protein